MPWLPYLYKGERENRSIFIICYKCSGFYQDTSRKGENAEKERPANLNILEEKAMNQSYIKENIHPSKPDVGWGDGEAREKSINPMGAAHKWPNSNCE